MKYAMNWKFWQSEKDTPDRDEEVVEKPKSKTREWVDAIVFAVVAATLIRWLIMEAYTIPTPSMENSLLVGDFLFVSKFHYGTRTTTTPLQIPLTHQKIWFTEIPSYLEWIRLPQFRLPGITEVKRGDVVVFNIPPKELNENKDYPVDLKTNYIKRAVAIPGDTLRIVNRQVFINGEAEENPPLMQFSYLVKAEGQINDRVFDRYDISEYSIEGRENDLVYYHMQLRPEIADELRTLPFVRSAEIAVANSMNQLEVRTEDVVESSIFPDANMYPWNGDFFGPLVIPAEGMTIEINDSTLTKYGSTILNYDYKSKDEIRIEGNQLLIGGDPVDTYTFQQDYYFMMGDNRHNSLDSRYWGFVPEDHIVGKAFFIWLSIDNNGSFFDRIRWNRFFRLIR